MSRTRRIYNTLKWKRKGLFGHRYRQYLCFKRCRCYDRNNFDERGWTWSDKKALKSIKSELENDLNAN